MGDTGDDSCRYCMRSIRFDDLKRWYTTSEIKTTFKANDKQGADNFQEKYKYYPIPSGELNNNNAMKQTELWK